MTKYIASGVAHYDEEKLLYYCYVGENKPSMPLLYTCWGTKAAQARANAKNLADLLNQ